LKKTLILGIGNDILTDDGIGPKLVNEIKSKRIFKDVDFLNVFLGGLDILELIQGYEKVIFIDAIITEDGVPGTVYHFKPADFKETLHLSNLHDANFLTALELGRKMGMQIPEDIHIIAIEIIEDRIFSDQFSPEIEIKFQGIFEKVLSLVNTSFMEENSCK
jgi:hydrogenase maturation protease